jgi:Mrp family chromosome partitioning ATPase/capsular polysaccharide biosynthesis protein
MNDQAQQFRAHIEAGGSNFGRVRRAALKRIKAIVALPILFALCATGFALLLPERYDAVATVQIDPRQKQPVPPSTAAAAEAERHTIENEIETLRSAPIVERAITELGLNKDPEFTPGWFSTLVHRVPPFQTRYLTDTQRAVRAKLEVARVRNTLLLSVGFSSRDPIKAARIANAIAQAYLDQQIQAKSRFASSTLPSALAGTANGKNSVQATSASERIFRSFLTTYGQELQLPGARIIENAEAPRSAAAPNRPLMIASAAVAGLIVALLLVFVLERKRPCKPRIEEVQQALACPHMTSVPSLSADHAARTLDARRVCAEPAGPYAEAIRNACTALQQHAAGLPSRVVLVVSALPGEGAELFASNLAHHLALSGRAPLLVDADFRMKGLTRRLARQSACGLLDQITRQMPLEEAILRDGLTGLHFLPASGPAPIPVSVPSALRSPALAHAVATLKAGFETIILSAPPLLPITDARILAGLADQIVFVTAWHKTPRPLARKALTSLGPNQRKVVGAVLTDVAATADDGIMSFADIFAEIRRAATFSRRAA